MFKRTETHLIELLHKESLGIIPKADIQEIIKEEKRQGKFNLDKAYDSIWGWIDPK